MDKEACPFEEGDRVDHKLFGMGTINGVPVAVVSPDLNSPTGVRDAGWIVPVQWDDPERTGKSVVSWALRKVSSPDSRPFTYWDRQWQPLLQEWLQARRALEAALMQFRPLPDKGKVELLQRQEEQAFVAMRAFVQAELDGRHP